MMCGGSRCSHGSRRQAFQTILLTSRRRSWLPQEDSHNCADPGTDGSEDAAGHRRASRVAGKETSSRVGGTLDCLVPHSEAKTNQGAEEDRMTSRPASLVDGLRVAVALSGRCGIETTC